MRRETLLLGGPRHGERLNIVAGPVAMGEVLPAAIELRRYRLLMMVRIGERLVEVRTWVEDEAVATIAPQASGCIPAALIGS